MLMYENTISFFALQAGGYPSLPAGIRPIHCICHHYGIFYLLALSSDSKTLVGYQNVQKLVQKIFKED